MIANGRAASVANLGCLVALSIAASMSALAAGPVTAADAARGARLAAICSSCHRLDGRDKGIPTIAGMDQKQLVASMAAFKSGARASQIMHAVALMLSDEEIATLANYLAALPRETKVR